MFARNYCVLCSGYVGACVQDVNTEDDETSCRDPSQLMKTEFSCSGHGKYSGITYFQFVHFFGYEFCPLSCCSLFFLFNSVLQHELLYFFIQLSRIKV